MRVPLRRFQAVRGSTWQFPLVLYLSVGGRASTLLSHLYSSYDISSDIVIIQTHCQRLQFYQMADLKQLFATVDRTPTNGVEGYYVRNKYFDARRSREERVLATSRERSKPLNVSPKLNFLDEVCKKEKKKPGPSTYDPYTRKTKPPKAIEPEPHSRTTIFDELSKQQTKMNIPAAGKYDRIELEPKKSKKDRSPMSQAEVNNYLDNTMRKSIEVPGIGNYNLKVEQGHQGPKWMGLKGQPKKRSESDRGIKVPDMGTYKPISYGLFDSISAVEQKQRPHFGKDQRFKSGKDKSTPFYNVASEWGMKNKLSKKDILSRVGSSVTHHSVYH